MRELFKMLGSKEAEPTITFAMLDEKMDMPFVREHFKSLGLDVFDAWSFFKLLDADASGQAPRTRGFQWNFIFQTWLFNHFQGLRGGF